MTASELRQKYFDFFIEKEHKMIPNVLIVPENDPSALFISAGMHPLVPYLLGEAHPLGKRLVSIQRCLRTGDIEEVGDPVHHTFFEMLGNWSLGDPASSDGVGQGGPASPSQGGYFKKEMISWSFEFLTSPECLGYSKERLAVSVFAGDEDAAFDEESFDAWRKLGIPEERIARLPKKNNWWGPAGETGPCGPDSEMFYWVGKEEPPSKFDPNDPKWVEIWNDVFMEFNKKEDGSYEPLSQKNVDTGMGMERNLAIMNGLDDDYRTELFWPIIEKLQELSGKKYEEFLKEFRVVADHLRGAIVLINDGVEPSNKQQGYVLRRLIRRSAVKMRVLGIDPRLAVMSVIEAVIKVFGDRYFESDSFEKISIVLNKEFKSFSQSIDNGIKILQNKENIDGKIAFDLYQSYGFPLEITLEIIKERNNSLDLEKITREYEEEFKIHQDLSRTSSAGMFKGGLTEQSEAATKYHTATHLLQAALREILGNNVHQAGSNITAERLRFDFSYPEKLTPEQLFKIEKMVTDQINKNVEVKMEIMEFEKSQQEEALTIPGEKYPERVKVYTINSFSKEVCGGPHVDFTGKLGKFKIIKEEGAGAGIRRIYAVLE